MTHEHGKERCIELAGRLSEYLDGELPPELAGEVEAHFEGCVDCERFMTSLQRVRGMGSLLPPEPLPPDRLREIAEAARRRLEDKGGEKA